MLSRLLANLYASLNKDPIPTPALNIAFTALVYPDGIARTPSSYWIHVEDDALRGTNQLPQATPLVGGDGSYGGVDVLPFNGPHPNMVLSLSGTTLAQLAAQMSALPGIEVTVAPGVNPTTSATTLCEGSQDVVANSVLSSFTSTLWAILKPIAAQLARSVNDMQTGLLEAQPANAEGFWLSTLGDLYGLDRLVSESDGSYATRILYHVLKPRTNNTAMAEYLRYAFGLANVNVLDDTQALHTSLDIGDTYLPFRFFVELDPGPDGGLPVSVPDLYDVVQNIKAWGTIWELLLRMLVTETIDITETEDNGQNIVITNSPVGGEELGLAPFDSYIQNLVFRYTDTLRPVEYPFTFQVWKNGSNVVISDFQDPNVIIWGVEGGWRSWVASIQDIWNGFTPNLPSFPDNANLVATMLEAYALTMAVSDSLSLVASMNDPSTAVLSQGYGEAVQRKMRPFTFADRGRLFQDPNALIGESPKAFVRADAWTQAQSWVTSISDPSWYSKH